MAFASTTSHTQSAFSMSIFARIAASFSRGLTQMQIARMSGVLSAMTNAQLAAIGITRGEIYDYAEMLIIGSAKK